MTGNRKGFTIVELLIVIVVIAILATITIVAFNGIQERANETAVRSDVRSLQQKMEIFRVDNGRYPTTVAELNSLDSAQVSRNSYQLGRNNLYYCVMNDGSNFSIGAVLKDPKGEGMQGVVPGLTGKGILISSGKKVDATAIDAVVNCNNLSTDTSLRTHIVDGYSGAQPNPTGWASWLSDQ